MRRLHGLDSFPIFDNRQSSLYLACKGVGSDTGHFVGFSDIFSVQRPGGSALVDNHGTCRSSFYSIHRSGSS